MRSLVYYVRYQSTSNVVAILELPAIIRRIYASTTTLTLNYLIDILNFSFNNKYINL